MTAAAASARRRDFKAPPGSPLGDHLRGLALGYERLGGSDEAKGRALGLRQAADLVDGAIAGQPELVALRATFDLMRDAVQQLLVGVDEIREVAADLSAASQVVEGPPSTAIAVSSASAEEVVYGPGPRDVAFIPRRTPVSNDGPLSRCARACLVVLVQRAPRMTTRAQYPALLDGLLKELA